MMCGFLFFVCGVIFAIGFGIGYAAFSKSARRVTFSVLSGFTAVVVAFGVLFAGCLVLISGANLH